MSARSTDKTNCSVLCMHIKVSSCAWAAISYVGTCGGPSESTSMLMRVSAILPSGLGTSSISVCSGISSRGMSCNVRARHAHTAAASCASAD